MMEPTKKSASVEKLITAIGGADRRDSIRARKCHPVMGCGQTISPSAIECWGPATRREFQNSGLCGPCQVQLMGGSTKD